jgi:type I restriction enzyme S subunit
MEKMSLPIGWKFCLLGTYMVKGGGSVDPSKYPNEQFDLYSIPAYDSQCPEILRGSEIGSTKKIVLENDVLLSRIVPHIQRSWVVGNRVGRRQIGSGEWMIFRGNDFVPKFMKYFLLSYDFHMKLMTTISGVGGSLTRANPTLTGQFEIPLPPLPEQRTIVAKIEELLSDLENGKQQLQTAQQQLKIYRQSLLKAVFEKKTGAITYKLIDVCDFITKGTTPSKDTLYSEKSDIPFLKVYNLTFNGTLDFTKDPTYIKKDTHNEFLKRSIVFPGDVLMNIVGPPLGKVSIVPYIYPEWNINQAIVRFRCKELLLNKYLLHFLLAENTIRTYSRKAKATAGQFNLTLEICRDIEIPIPSLKEQNLIVSLLESRLTICDNISATITQSLAQAETLRQSILKKAFEGKLVNVVPEIDKKKEAA